jgi:hypothetical protein
MLHFLNWKNLRIKNEKVIDQKVFLQRKIQKDIHDESAIIKETISENGISSKEVIFKRLEHRLDFESFLFFFFIVLSDLKNYGFI